MKDSMIARAVSWPRATLDRLLTALATLSATGVVFTVIAWAVSLAPSLIPRTWLFQGVLTGLCMALGYAFGTSAGGFARWLGFETPWSPATTKKLWLGFIPLALVLILGSAVYSLRFQNDLRELFGMPQDDQSLFLTQAVIAILLLVLLLRFSRFLRKIGRWVATKLNRWFPYRAAVLSAVIIVGLAFALIVDGTLIRGTMSGLNTMYATSDKKIPDDVVAPTGAERSGSPDSLNSWESLGYQGRAFVTSGPTKADIEALATTVAPLQERDLKEPIRVYAGLEEGRNLDETAHDVVAELNRTNAWDREVLVVATATGTGWVDPSFSSSIEYLYGGDTAIASMQYSYLPSGVAFLTDRATPPIAGKALFEAIYEEWSARPENDRPLLYVFGLSLGSYGMQGAFSGLQDLTERTDAAVFVGTPNFTSMWKNFTEKRDVGSPEIEPIFDKGERVRFSSFEDNESSFFDHDTQWKNPRIAYVQHPSDAVTWWTPELIWNEPDWMKEPKAHDRPQDMRWIPIVTFLQLSFDMFVSGNVPAGHGHNYVREYAEAIAAVADHTSFTPEEMNRIQDWVQFGPHPTDENEDRK